MRPPGTERRLPGQELGWIGGWRLTGILGRGNMGVVYVAEREGFPRAALKVLHDLQVRDGEDLRFEREVQALRRLEHAAIVRVLDAGRERGRAYLATELCQGETLDRVLVRRGRLGPWEAGKLALDLASALDHAHRHGVIHRDLKPSNVIVEPDTGRARLFDFGVARLEDAGGLTRTGEILGTPLYMAPEQILGEKGVDHRVDLWALGVVLHECLTGERPFRGRDLPEVCASILHEPIRTPRQVDPALPAALDAVVRRALERERERRYPDAPSLAGELRAFLSPPAATKPPSPAAEAAVGSPAAALTERRPAWRLAPPTLLAGLVLALGAGLAGGLVVWRGAPPAARDQASSDPPPASSPPARAAATPPPASTPPPPTPPESVTPLERARARARERAPASEVLPLLDEALAQARRKGDERGVEEALFERADLLRRRGRFAEAVEAASELAGRAGRPGLEAGIVRGLALLRLGRPEEGLGALEAVHLADPQGASGLCARAIHGVFTGDPHALEQAEAALARDPAHVQALTTRGWALLNLGRTPEAVAALRAQEALAPDDPRVLYGLGSALRAAGDPQAALRALDRAQALLEPPGFWLFQLTRLEVLGMLGRERERRAELDRWLRHRPDDGEALLVRGLLRVVSRDGGGLEDWSRARALLGPEGYREQVGRYFPPGPLADRALEVGLR